ncbi:MAG: DUF6049 family protein [Thiolinea sp.]
MSLLNKINLVATCILMNITHVSAAELTPIEDDPKLTEFPARIIEDTSKPQAVDETVPIAQPKALSDAEAKVLLERLPPLPKPAEIEDFAIRPGSEPPPKTTNTLQQPFPPPATTQIAPAVTNAGAVNITRFAPQGEVEFAKQISISFDRPMVAVSTQGQTLAESVPVTMTPALEGNWRWLGTQTLVFEQKNSERLPMATEYKLDVPATTKAADGSLLAKPMQWSFKTPTLKLQNSYPSGESVALTPLLFLAFNQRIEPEKVLPFIQIAANGQKLTKRLATEDEIKADKEVAELAKQAPEGQALVLKLEQALTTKTKVTVNLSAKAPSVEGPRETPAQTLYSFSTYAPLTMTESRCGYGRCTRYDGAELVFNNPLAPDQDLEKLITISPELKQVERNNGGERIYLSARWQANTTYTVTLSPELKDQYGQALTGKRSFSFKVDKSPANLALTDKILATLDPSMPAELRLYSTNLRNAKLTIQQVAPSDWPAFYQAIQKLRQERYDPKKPLQLPGKLLSKQTLTIKDQTDTLITTPIALGQWLKEGKFGHLLLWVEAGEATVKPTNNDSPLQPQLVWVQGTRLSLDAYSYPDKILAWGGDLLTAKPVSNLALSLHSSTSPTTQTQTTDAQGLASLAYLDQAPNPNQPNPVLEQEPTIRWLEAKQGEDTAILPEALQMWFSDTWRTREQAEQKLWYVFDDRHLYRPNEEVHLKGWVRERAGKPAATLELPKDLAALNYEVMDAAGNKIAEGATKLSGLGGFDLNFKLPDTPNLGPAQVVFKKPNATESELEYTHGFEIQEFRTPEFEVKTELTKAAPYLIKQDIPVSANANYYAGGGLAAAPVAWQLVASQEAYTPPNQTDWSFGFSNPIWWHWDAFRPQENVLANFSGKTNPEGKHALLIQPNNTNYPLPVSVRAEASVTDVNRQAWTSSSQFIIHPANTYVGLKTDSYFVEQNQPLKLDVLTVDIDGKVLANSPVIVEAGLPDHSNKEGVKKLKDVQRCTVQTDAQGLAKCEFKTDKAGQYRITATTMDSEGRRNASRITRWVSGDTEAQPAANNVEMESARIIPDKDSYAPNETAKLLIQAPFKDAEGLLLVSHNGLVTEQRFTMQGNSHTLKLALKPEWLPNVNLTVNLLGQTVRQTANGEATTLPPRPAMASAEFSLKITNAERKLAVKVQPQKEALAPAEETAISVQIQDDKGQPVANAEVALIVADEAILAAGNYQLADPLNTFYPESTALMMAQYFRSSILLPVIPEMEAANAGIMLQQATPASAPTAAMVVPAIKAMGRYRGENKAEMGLMRFAAADAAKEVSGASGGAAPSAMVARTNFNPLAAFVPNLITDAQGQVTTMVKLPDNLTRYRIMAVAAKDATHYGKGESHLTARKELMVRPSAPRFLNFGDSFELPVVLQNQSDQPMSVQVALDATNLELTAAKGYTVEVPANDRVEVRFPAKAVNVGQVDYQIAAATSTLNDAASGSLPVWTPATSEAFATYGVVDQGAVSQAIETPKQVLPQFGELKITTSSTALQTLSDAFIYLQNYPYSCSEQIASRMLSTAALKDVLQAFKTKDLPSPEAIEQSMQRDLESLAKRQTGEGGFSLWGSGSQDWPYANVHVTHALIRAKEKGYKVDAYMLEQSLNYLRSIEQHFTKDYTPEVRRYIKAYSLYVRQLVGDEDPAKAQALIKQEGGVTKLSTEALGWLLNVLASHPASAKAREELVRELMNRTQETAAGATLRSDLGAGDYWVMHSDRTANGIVLEALIKAQPQSDLIPKLVKGIQTERTRGHWGTTQANAFILLGLDKYFQQYEAQTPDFVAKAWLGNDFAGEQSFKGRSMDSVETDIPMAWLLKGEQRRDLVLDKQGAGRLYYRIGLKYAPESLDLAAMEQGFSVTRSYRGLDNPDDVKQREDGTWQVKAGTRVEVNLTMLAPAERHHVALVDALPAGFEALNPALAVTAQNPDNNEPEPMRFSWMRTWYEYQNLRDERAEAFSSFLPDGVYHYSYLARATTPGSFIAPPAKAEEMYHPETFGRSASAKVVIE